MPKYINILDKYGLFRDKTVILGTHTIVFETNTVREGMQQQHKSVRAWVLIMQIVAEMQVAAVFL